MPRQTYPPQSLNALGDTWQGVKVERATATLPQSTHAPIFNITGGRVVVTAIIGTVTTVLGAVGNVKLTSYNTAGSVSSDLCAVVAAGTTAAYAQLSIDGVPGDAMIIGLSAVQAMTACGVICPAGTIDLSTSASSTGSIKWTLCYVPFDQNATVTAA
jgi:hypothetical protein